MMTYGLESTFLEAIDLDLVRVVPRLVEPLERLRQVRLEPVALRCSTHRIQRLVQMVRALAQCSAINDDTVF